MLQGTSVVAEMGLVSDVRIWSMAADAHREANRPAALLQRRAHSRNLGFL